MRHTSQTSSRLPRKRGTRVEEVAGRLRVLIASRNPQKDESLPSEPELSRRFAASRATVRQALTLLEAEGVIIRRRGLGTFVNPLALNMTTRLEEVWDYREMIRVSGYAPSSEFVGMSLAPASSKVAEKLGLAPGSEVLTTTDVFLANGIPVICCADAIPAGLVRHAYVEKDLKGSIYSFLESRCGQHVDYNIAEVIPTVAEKRISTLLNCRRGSPLLYLEEVGFNTLSQPVVFSEEYYRPEFFSFRVLRKKTSVVR